MHRYIDRKRISGTARRFQGLLQLSCLKNSSTLIYKFVYSIYNNNNNHNKKQRN